MSAVAFADESYSKTGPYILGAVLVDADHLDLVRSTMLALRLDSSRKLHFHDERKASRRLEIATALAGLPVQYVLAINPALATRTERRRRHAMRQLVLDLATMGIKQLVLESRGRHDDKRDSQLLQHLRVNQELRAELRMGFEKGPAEPCLWAADALCGVAGQHFAGQPELLEIVKPQIFRSTDLSLKSDRPRGIIKSRHVA